MVPITWPFGARPNNGVPRFFPEHLQTFAGTVFVIYIVYRILGSKTKNTVYSSFLSLTVEKTISYYYLLSLLVPIISYYSFWGGSLYQQEVAVKQQFLFLRSLGVLKGLERSGG